MRRANRRDFGVVVFSVELELAIGRPSHERQQRLDHVAGELLALFSRHQVPATWAVADPARSAATPALWKTGLGHEIAVLGESSWIGRGAGRLRVERELARRFGGARSAGMSVGTLILRNVAGQVDLDLLLAHNITAVSMPHGTAERTAETLRFGVWQAPPPWRLPLAPRWWMPLGWQAARHLHETVSRRQVLHVSIDGDALVDQNRGLEQVLSIVGQTAELRSAGKLLVQTLGELGSENLAQRSAQPAKSLLAPAA